MSIKERFYQNLQESREQLDELRGKGTLDKKDKEKLQGRIRKKHGKAWTETERIRKEKGSKGSADTKHMDKFRNRLAKMHNKLDEEQLDELGDPTHMSYRAKARNQLDKMVNRLGSKIGSDTVNTKKMRNRAEGIKKSYKLQPKKKLEEEQLDETDKMKLPKGYGKILPKDDMKNRKVLKKSNMHKRAAKAGMNVPKGYGDIVSYDKK